MSPSRRKRLPSCASQIRVELDNGGEYGVELAGGARDDLQHLGSRRLLFERFRQVTRALAQFVEQPRIFHGDDGLIRKSLDQFDLLGGEGTNSLAAQGKDAYRGAFAQQRNTQHGVQAAEFCALLELIFWVTLHVGDLYRASFRDGAAGNEPRPVGIECLRDELVEFGRVAVACDLQEFSIARPIDGRHVGFT